MELKDLPIRENTKLQKIRAKWKREGKISVRIVKTKKQKDKELKLKSAECSKYRFVYDNRTVSSKLLSKLRG